MITVSLCMIVKNEEQVLDRCLRSVADLVEEVIVVDTGSTDRTKEIAGRYTENVYDFQWTDDFAAARNFSFSKATKEYIYCADADEVLDECNRERFKQLKQILLPEIEIVQMYYCNQLKFNTVYNYDKEYRPKMYKRIRQFCFHDPIHEVVRLDPVVYDSDIEILHLPVCEHAGRDLKSFENMCHNGVRLSRRLHGMYAKELFIAGMKQHYLNAEAFFEGSVADESRSLDEVKEACCVVARAARLRGDIERFFKYALKNVASEGCAEICFELGEYFQGREDYEEAALWYYNAAFETECILYAEYGRTFALQALSHCYSKLGDEEKAKEILQNCKNQINDL